MAKDKIVFIDRDGVINKDPGGWTPHSYVTKWGQFRFLPGARRAIKELTEAGYDIIVISNQAGISKGFYSVKDLNGITRKMLGKIAEGGGRIKRVYYCTHQTSDGCACRKPKPGLLRKAGRDLGVGIAGRYFIGDGLVDIEAGKRARLRTILLLSGKTDRKDVKRWDVKPDFIFKDLPEAVDFILKRGGR
ncbi:MAG: HAD family hydrolase [Candidatus Omnitrophota bacterium]